ncbi:hypothetical protein ACHAWO_010421 [Cyclotella atomus]|uniref:EF-hand domain-containing protein n=1 Tax=Cyclotella atomus TaxID=382360 RepID=A0ABD3Q5H9_9STRA
MIDVEHIWPSFYDSSILFSRAGFCSHSRNNVKCLSVPLSSMTTPEDHLSRVRKLSAGFELLFGALRSSSYQGVRKKSWKSLASFDSGTKRMSSVLKEYDDEIHGEEVGRRCLRCLICCKGSAEETKDVPVSRMQSMRQTLSMSIGLKSSVTVDDKAAYYRMFNYIDKSKEHKISKCAFESFLRSVGLKDEVGLEFALGAFQLLDLDGSGDIDSDEFIAFAKISKYMPAIRDLVAKFFDFVDVNGDRAVEIAELDSSRAYLSLPAISEADRDSLTALCNEEEELEFDMIVNFVTIFKLKSIIKDYQVKRVEGLNLDDSVRSSIRP